MAAVAAASCMEFTGGGRVDMSVRYEAYLDAGIDGKTAKYEVEKITVNPGFNATSLTNNIAVLEYNAGSKETWQSPFYPRPMTDTGPLMYVQSWLSNADKMTWGTESKAATWSYGDQRCKYMSNVYDIHIDHIDCTNLTMQSPLLQQTSCPIPLGLMYTMADGLPYLSGILGYTASAKSIAVCDEYNNRNYHTYVAEYIAYIQKVLGRDVYYGKDVFDEGLEYPADFDMIASRFTFAPNVVIKGGDLFKDATLADGASESGGNPGSSSSEPDTSGSPDSSDLQESSDSQQGDSESGSSKRAAVIAGVCGSIGGAAVVAIAVLCVFKWRRRRRPVDPVSQARIQEDIAGDFGVARTPRVLSTAEVQAAIGEAGLGMARGSRVLSAAEAQIAIEEGDLPPVYDAPPCSSTEQPLVQWQQHPPKGHDADAEKGGLEKSD
ncbi:hypothetical protein H4R18_005742 [Coemansia javaensis]|uniref:Peptidase S1 domain-containing protein n=1 Tax=Coemansia javaensis TaxID=2761396 RepID=A0A9W8LED2_9FUNG|nr:hypothetical protein H4R18_005742 [Coemansia javaensis]